MLQEGAVKEALLVSDYVEGFRRKPEDGVVLSKLFSTRRVNPVAGQELDEHTMHCAGVCVEALLLLEGSWFSGQ